LLQWSSGQKFIKISLMSAFLFKFWLSILAIIPPKEGDR